jgi:3-methyladenine DNA glycosylase AlkD
MMRASEILSRLKTMSDPEAVQGMARFGIATTNTYGVSIPNLRKLAKEIGVDHALARELWSSRVHEARILASMIDDPALVTTAQMERWVLDFDSWDVCDQCCLNLFSRADHAWAKVGEWSARPEEFVKRAAFALVATLAVHDRKADDHAFLSFLRIIEREATDQRNYVRKAVNWALRQIGKRNHTLNRAAIATAMAIQKIDSPSASWIASDALRELTSASVRARLKEKAVEERRRRPTARGRRRR